jgi:predicted ATP-binding protein involved in virulence
LGGSANWANVSSGQKAYLNMYALIWAEVEKVISTNKKQDFIICIDEGDLYLHPQWQVSFVKDVVKYLPVIFSGCVQIVLTTHSPLLVSDIPMQCINMLSRNVLDQTMLNFLKDGNTFGANIYDIYSGVFGLGEERKSSLSNSYIDNVMLILRKEALSDSDRNELRSSLKLIGDDLIRFHIKKRLNKID